VQGTLRPHALGALNSHQLDTEAYPTFKKCLPAQPMVQPTPALHSLPVHAQSYEGCRTVRKEKKGAAKPLWKAASSINNNPKAHEPANSRGEGWPG
jgi:hypothetical protein